MTAPNTQVATTEQKVNPIIALFTGDTARLLISKFLPEGTQAERATALERVAATVLLAIRNDKTKKLIECTPESLVLGVARIQQWGLELGTTAHLIPFGKEATPVADYKGLAELMIGSGAIRYIDPKVVYAGDKFEYRFGTDAKIDHTPGPKAKRGAITHAYVIIHLPGGRQVFDVMLAEDIDEIRQKCSKQWKDGPLKPWYAKKTMVRQASKLIPKNPRFAESFARFAKVLDDEQSVEIVPLPDAPGVAALRATVNEPDDDDLPFQDDRDIDDDPRDERETGFKPPY